MDTSLFTTPAGVAWLLALAARVAVLLALSGLAAALLRRAPAAARHQIWTLGVAAALLLPLLAWALPSLALPAMPSLSSGSSALPTVVDAAAPATALAPDAHATSSVPATWPAWLALAWAAGTLLVALRFLRGHLAARRLARAASPADAPAWSSALADAAAALAVTRPIYLRRSAAIDSPMTVELGHVRRHDTLVQLAAQLACALYWWNPLTWLAAVRLRTEREHACDDLVLATGVRPSSYAADLLDVARTLATHAAARASAGAVGMADASCTETRLRRILDDATPRRPVGARFRRTAQAAALVLAATLACTSAPRERASQPASAKPPASAPRVSVGAPFIEQRGAGVPSAPAPAFPSAPEGTIELARVVAEVNRHLAALDACYQGRLATNPQLAGTVLIHFSVTTAGTVGDQCITQDTVGDRGLRDCVNALVAAGTYPAAQGGAVDVTFPFVFAP